MTSLISQTNYFYLDLDKNIANGCSEFIVENRSELKLFIGNLKIQEILCNGDVADCQFSTEEHKCSSSDNSGSNTTNSLTQSQPYQRFDKRQSKYSQILDKRKIVKIWTRMGKNTIVIKFKPNLTFYSQMDQFDDHKEVIGAMNKQVFFPFLDEMTNLKLIYVVNPDLTVLSSGQMENVIEQDEFAIHTFLTITFPRNIAFCVGKFEKFELSSSKILFLPKYQDYSEIKHEILSTQKIMNHYSINDKSLQIHLIFPYSDIETDAENLIIKPFGNFPFKQDIEQNFRFRQNIGISMASQLFMKIEFKKEDLWLKTGLIGYIGNQIAKNSLGTNEFLYQLKIDINQVVSEDKEHLPLFSFSRSIESCQTEFFMKKSQIFFQILENVTSFSSLQKIIKSILTQSTISTESFINIVKDSTGRDLSHEKQIFKNSATLFTGDLSIDQKKNTVKVVFNKPVNTLIQSNELEGVFEYPIKKEVTYTYHNRRKREEESVLFIKIDPYITQINNFKIILKNTMYNFLTKDKNILSQLEGVQHVDEVELERIIYDHNVNYHIRLLAMNYLGINSIFSFFVKKFCIPGSTIIKPNSFTILNHFLLIGLINTLSFSNPHTTREIVTNNSIKSEQTPIQDVKNTDQKRTVTHGAIIKAFYHNILRYNDNSSNQYSDGTFVSSIIRNFSFMFVSYTDETFNEFIEQNDLYFEIIERYRRKDLIFPSFGNQITCSVLYFYGKLDLYGIIELDFDYLHFLLQETNYIDIRCCAAEILTFKNICDESSECPEQLINLLSLDDKIIETVLQTLLNMLETDFYMHRVKSALFGTQTTSKFSSIESQPFFSETVNYDQNDRNFIAKLASLSENCKIRHLAAEICLYLQNDEISLLTDLAAEHEFSSSSSCVDVFEDAPKKIKIKIFPMGNTVVKLRLKEVKNEVLVKRIIPKITGNGLVRLKLANSSLCKRKSPLINVKRTRANRKNKIVYPRLAISKKYNFFVNKKFYEETRDDFKMEFKFKNDIENENDLIWHIKQAILDQQIGSYLYNKAVQYLEDLHNSKFEIDLENAGEFTILKPEDKKALTKHLDNLNIPRCNRHKKYKDVVGKTETICSMKKKLENVAVVEMVQREIAIFLENIRFFDQETDLNEGPLLEYLDSLEITEIKSISELLIECLEIIKTKKCAAPFIEFDKTDRSKITISLIQEKITKYEYKNLKEVTDDMERIVSIAEEFDNSSKYTDDAKASFKWFKKVVGGMLGGLFDSD